MVTNWGPALSNFTNLCLQIHTSTLLLSPASGLMTDVVNLEKDFVCPTMRTTNYCTGHMHSGLTSALIKKGLTSALDHHRTTSLLTSTQVGFEFGGSMFVVFY